MTTEGAINTTGLHPNRSRPAADMPAVSGRCPSCRSSSLFLAVGGWVTCANIQCPDPTAVADLLDQSKRGGPLLAGLDLLVDLVDDSECSYDHNRDCQTHCYFGLEGEDCPQAKLKALLDRNS